MIRRRTVILCTAGLVAAGCTVGPDYQRPEVFAPGTYRGAEAVPADTGTEPSFGDLAWASVFTDPDLQVLIRTALEQNYDLK